MTGNEEMKKPARAVKPRHSRPLVVLITKDDEQFPELLKTVRRKVDPGVTDNSISRMRKQKQETS